MNPVVHFEIYGSDRVKLSAFYEKVFGWHIQQDDSMDYGMIDTHGGRGFNGAVTSVSEAHQQGIVLYVEVENIDASLAQAVELGAEVLVPVTEIPEVVTFAMFVDPHGNVTGIVRGNGEGPQVSPGDGNPVTWFEIMGNDASIQAFYLELFGWKTTESPQPGYGTIGWEASQMGGAVGAIPEMPAYVAIYPEVQDVDGTLEKAAENGGKILMQAQDMSQVGVRVGMFSDPDGNMLGVYKQIPVA